MTNENVQNKKARKKRDFWLYLVFIVAVSELCKKVFGGTISDIFALNWIGELILISPMIWLFMGFFKNAMVTGLDKEMGYMLLRSTSFLPQKPVDETLFRRFCNYFYAKPYFEKVMSWTKWITAFFCTSAYILVLVAMSQLHPLPLPLLVSIALFVAFSPVVVSVVGQWLTERYNNCKPHVIVEKTVIFLCTATLAVGLSYFVAGARMLLV